MAPTNVSDCVLSIIGVFASGLDVFRRFRELRDEDAGNNNSRRLRKSKPAVQTKVTEQELLLVRSLRQGPEQIGREYQMCQRSLGDQYATGDAIAHISLADIQLRLNTGLVNIIHKFLSRDKKRNDLEKLDYGALLSLSETARMDTCRTLRDLYRRIKQLNLSAAMRPAESDKRTKQADSSAIRSKKPIQDSKKSRPHKARRPTIARVYIEDSSRPSQVAIVKPGTRTKTRVAPVQPATGIAKTKSPPRSSSMETNATPPPVYEAFCGPQMRSAVVPDRVDVRTNAPIPGQASTARLPETKVPPHLSAWLASTHEFETIVQTESPAAPVSAPQVRPTRDVPVRATAKPAMPPRRTIPTYHSQQTASTRLGEIPLHRWAEAWDFEAAEVGNRLAKQQGWPVTGELAVPKQVPEAKRRFWSGWRKAR